MDSNRSCPYDPVGRDISLSEYNEERWRHIRFIEAFSKGYFKIICDWCAGPLEEQNHLQGVNQAEGIPKVQMLCKGCKQTSYKII